ncbi:hypothetical protein [Bifidobacterium tibiigranuli]|jgi:hypothetical protein|uniref:Uncharacterized protein n=2 Tax=Bifidobacterium TaxID=1678 RepID=A0A5N6S6Z3_9BIFI|nr:hypothetical protein [Bifidobacterium tibiigranuli]KAE8130205.1 hypothetical protein DDE84_01105 [Bifidobacterium tibiigranuli]KAE8130436.1 hypothetical protein DDF78_00550 [Bifidobacterium tibiigranuli]
MNTIDLRPQAGSIIYELARLGFQFDHSDDGTAQTWVNYAIQARADFTSPSATEIMLGDMATRLSATIQASELAGVDHISTWTSDNPTTPETPAETPADGTGEPTA